MRASGNTYERQALEALTHRGLSLLTRNYNTRHGELDLVMREGNDVVFVEVRYRRRGHAASSVAAAKQTRLIRAASLWLAAHPAHAHRACRFDVVSFDGPSAEMCWWRGAFEVECA